jgi:cytochrome c oxidase subunit 2
MIPNFPLFPQSASAMASEVDRLFLFAVGIATFFSALIAILILFFAAKYRRRHALEVGAPPGHGRGTTILEITWSVIPLMILMVMFFWGARIFFAMARPPSNATEFYAIGKQWMWKIQHPEGNQEINELHLPIGIPVKLTMTSEDVIHSFYVPAFRAKMDVIPGRYTTIWFLPNRVGTYHLFCAEYCGAEHSRMIGNVIVMEPHDYQAWLAGERAGARTATSGADLFAAKACNTCHRTDTAARAPILAGLIGRKVALADGRVIVADAQYFRESLMEPQAKVVAGYQPIMPTFKGQLTEEEIIQLLEYVRSLTAAGEEAGGAAADAAGAAAPAAAAPEVSAPGGRR